MFTHANHFFWDEWTNPHPVGFDGPRKLIQVQRGITSLDVETDLYSNWKEWVQRHENAKFEPAFRTVGGDPTVGGRALGATFFLINGWRIRTWEGDHRLTVDGNLYTEEGAPPFIPTVGYSVVIESTVSSLVDRLAFIPTAEQSADAIWGELLGGTSAQDLLSQAASNTVDESSIAAAVWDAVPGANPASAGELLTLVQKILRNKTVTNPNTGQMVVFDDDDTTVLLQANVFEDVDAVQPYRSRGAERRERLS